MSESPPPPRTTFHAAVLHPDGPRVLMLEEASGWALPSLEPQDAFFAQVAPLKEAVASRFGLDAAVLRCAHRWTDENSREVDALFILAARGPAGPKSEPEAGSWVSLAELSRLPLKEPAHRAVLERSLREDADPRLIPARRPPWARRGWLEEAEAWTRAELTRLGRPPTGPLEQVKQWSITSLGRVATARGAVYFKAVPPLFAGEPGITAALAALFPGEVPVPLATDPRGWMLLGDFGGTTLQASGAARWPEVLRRYAELQVAAAEHRGTLLAAGCLDRRLERLEAGFSLLLREGEEVLALTDEERAALGRLVPEVRERIARLQSYRVPETLVHGDFHSNNVALVGDGVVFFDWTDGALGHPFFDLTALFHFYDARALTPDLRERALEAYLEPWTTFEPMPRLREAAAQALTLSLLHHAISYDSIRRSQEEGARWELEGVTGYLLRTLLEELTAPGGAPS